MIQVTGMSLVAKHYIDQHLPLGNDVMLDSNMFLLKILSSFCSCRFPQEESLPFLPPLLLVQLGQSISTLALDCLLLIQCHSTVTVYSHGYWSLVMHQAPCWRQSGHAETNEMLFITFEMIVLKAEAVRGFLSLVCLSSPAQKGNLCGLALGESYTL